MAKGGGGGVDRQVKMLTFSQKMDFAGAKARPLLCVTKVTHLYRSYTCAIMALPLFYFAAEPKLQFELECVYSQWGWKIRCQNLQV